MCDQVHHCEEVVLDVSQEVVSTSIVPNVVILSENFLC